MMGVQAVAARLFYDFCLDDHVPAGHQLRGIDQHLDLERIRAALKPFYSSTGRPSIDPELMIRMLLVGYCMGIRSERRLCEEVHLNLAYRWFCRLGLDGKVPDHSTFSKNRHGRFRESDILRHLFDNIVERCLAEGLVGAEGFAVDASLISADCNKSRSLRSEHWNPEELKNEASRAAREYLATLDDAAFGAASPATPKFISPSDPAAQWTAEREGHAFFAYADNYLIDTDHGVIVDVEATRAIRQAEVGASRTMLERTEERFGLKPGYLVADTAYGSAKNLAWLVKQKQITPHIPVFRQIHPHGRHILARGLYFRSRRQSLHLPGRPASASVSPQLCRAENRRHRRGDAPLSRHNKTMRRVRSQTPLLSQHGGAKNSARCRRRRARCRPRASRNTGI